MQLFFTITSFSEDKVWSFLIQLFIILIAIIIGNALRRKIPFIKKSLMPSALLGGLCILLLKLIPWVNDLVNQEFMEMLTYHALGLGFIAISLKTVIKDGKTSKMKVIETGALTASSYVIQGIVGLVTTIVLFYIINTFFAAGLLLPMGFGQGPGQALNFGKIYESNYNFSGGTSFGLTIATIGFLVASIVGVVYMNILKRKGKLNTYSIEESKKNQLEDFESENEIPNAESVDKLTIQFALVFVVYAFVYLFMYLISLLPLGNFGTNTLQPLVWGFNFLWGVLFATIAKKIIQFLKKRKIMHRSYTNSYLLDRISGFMFDLMILAGTAAIEFDQIKGLILPLVLVCSLGTIATFIYVNIACKHLYPEYRYEAFFTMFGMLTGTASNGVILLREIDPKFKTPAANNLVFQNFPAIIFGFPILLLMSFAPKGITQSFITLILLILFYLALVMFIFRTKIFKKKVKIEQIESVEKIKE